MSKKIKQRPPSALKRSPVNTERSLQEAITQHQAGDLDAAERLYRRVLEIQPKHADTLNLLATVFLQKGDFRPAISLLKKAISLRPERADYYSNLGSAERGAGELDKAVTSFLKALTLHPGHLESQFNLGQSQLELGEFASAAASFQRILQTKPTFVPAHEMLAQSLLGQGLFAEALNALHAVIEYNPQHSNAYCEIGNIHQAQSQFPEAIRAYEQAISSNPANAVAHNNLGNTLVKQGKLHSALREYQEALLHDPNLAEASINLSWTYREHGLIGEDVACLKHHLQRHQTDHRAHSDMLFSMNYDPAYSPEQLYRAANTWWQEHAPKQPPLFHHAAYQPGKKLRIGFLSPDFREHPVGTFLLPLFSSINQEQESSLHCYAEIHEQQMDAVSHRFRDLASSWHCTASLSAIEAATRIHEDQIDILIDLAGHSANNRLDIMALRAAPLQASWLGYVNTTGLPVIQYRITDAVADPPGMEAYYSESLLRLPDTFFCYAPPASSPPVGELPALSTGQITFGSLNNPAKINGEVIALWAKILLAVPNSRLLLVGKPFADEFIKDRYLDLFAHHGVSADRLEPISTLPMQDYLQLYNKIDIALDPFPHNGHTITCHTLWMGVPVITLAGNRYAARMGASILSAIGLPELIAHTQDNYLQLAENLAKSLDRLVALRQIMRHRLQHSSICDTQRFSKKFILAMHDMVHSLPKQNNK
ncbi:MAG: tetratricopeptide repeat protein [Desulfobulbaceae bacterium]|nr:tetratricopeptide repeat protein [Desulfobulbaceae bacterium]